MSSKLNKYQRSIRKHKKAIASLSAKKGVPFMKAAAMMLKKSPRKSADCEKRGKKVFVRSHKKGSKRVKSSCRKSPRRSHRRM